MAKNYSAEEQQAAIQRLVRPSVRREYGALANRRTDVTFSDIQDAAAGVFILYPSAPYYVVKLGCIILEEQVVGAENTLDDLLDTVQATGRRVHPLEKISALANARSALTALSTATAKRDTAIARIEDVPAFQRFDQSTSRFLADAGPAISTGGEVVQTPKEARSRMAGLVTLLMDQYATVLERTEYLAGAIADFDAMQLPARLSNSVVSNSEQVLSQRFDQLEALSPEERLGVLRDVVLDVLATRSTVRGFGALAPTGTFLYFSGSTGPYADSSHPATAAFVEADLAGPHTILDDATLDLVVNGTTTISVDVPGSYVAAVESYIPEPYDVVALTNDKLLLDVTGHPRITVPLTAGSNRTAQQIATDIAGFLGFSPLLAEPYGPQLYLQGAPATMSAALPDVTFTRALGSDWGDIVGFTVGVGDWLQVTSSTLGNEGWYKVTDVSGLPATFIAQPEDGTAVSETDVVLSLNHGGRAVRVTFKDAQREAAVDARKRIGVPVDGDSVAQATHYLLGIPSGAVFQCEPTRVADCVKFINSSPAIAPLGTALLEATAVLDTPIWDGELRSDPLDATKVVLSKLNATGVVTGVSFSGPLGTITLGSLSEDPVAAGVTVGDYLVIRGVSVEDQVGRFGEVSAVSTTSITCRIEFGTTGVNPGDVWTFEVGPDLRVYRLPLTLVVASPETNQGVYDAIFHGGVDESGPPFELGLNRTLIQFTELGSQPHYFQGQVGQYLLRLTSKNTLLSTRMEVLNTSSAGDIFWNTLPVAAVGETKYFQLGTAPLKVETQDYLELHNTGAQSPTYQFEVARTGTNPNVLELTQTVSTTLGSWAMAQGSSPPYGRIRKRKRNNYDVLQGGLAQWLDAQNYDRFFSQLRRLLNPILVNQNPTAVAINDALNHLYTLQVQLDALQVQLGQYNAPLVEQVDTLIDTYYQQSADRAVDILVQARFSDFFGLNQNAASYAGDLQQNLRDVEAEDLPQKKFKRRRGGEVFDSYEEKDFEFDFSDTEGDNEDVRPVGESYDYGDNSAF